MNLIAFVGRGPIPEDMLRYDSCVVVREVVDNTNIPDELQLRIIWVEKSDSTSQYFTYPRWHSFGWTSLEYNEDPAIKTMLIKEADLVSGGWRARVELSRREEV